MLIVISFHMFFDDHIRYIINRTTNEEQDTLHLSRINYIRDGQVKHDTLMSAKITTAQEGNMFHGKKSLVLECKL